MNLNQLPKIKDRTKKRLGRGLGSGKGKTGGRGQKGQKARGKVPAAAVGGGLILYKKLPFNKGLGNRKVSAKPEIVTLTQLETLTAKSTVDIQSLVDNNIVKAKNAQKNGVKVLATGTLTKALTIQIPVSKKVKELVEKAGGSVLG